MQSSFASIDLHTWVSQGYVLSPILFLIYVNITLVSLLSLTRLYADDSLLYYSVFTAEAIGGIVNHDFDCIQSAMAKSWLVDFNPNKSEAILFTFKKEHSFPRLV